MELQQKRKIDLYLGTSLLLILKVATLFCRLICFWKWSNPKENQSPAPEGSIVILKFLGGGSLVIALPALRGLKEQYPDYPLYLVTTPTVVPYAELLHVFDEILVIDDKSLISTLCSTVSFFWRFRKIDLVIDLEVHSRLSCVFSVLTRARVNIGYYMEDTFWKRGLCTHLIFFNRHSPMYCFYEKVIQLLSAQAVSFDDSAQSLVNALPTPPEDIPVEAVCIGHACSDLGKERSLSPQEWKEALRLNIEYQNYPACLLFLGSEHDYTSAEAIITVLQEAYPELAMHNLCGRLSLGESAAIIHRNGFFWGIDSGLLHLARLTDTRIQSFFGPTDPEIIIHNIDKTRETIWYEKIPCSPCVHNTEKPPCEGNNICIQNLFLKENKKKQWIGCISSTR